MQIDNDVELTQAETDMKSLKIRAEGRGVAKTIKAQAESDQIQILAQAQAKRISKIDAAMGKVCTTSKNREMILSSAESLGKAETTVIFSDTAIAGGDITNGNLGNFFS